MRVTSPTSRTYTEATVRLADGTGIEYARRGAAGDVHVVFLHGWPDSWRSFQPVMEALPDEITAVSVSLPGFGGSDAIASPARPSDLARSIIALCDALGIERAVFVGHSLGTLVCQRIAERRPELARGLVLMGAFASVSLGLAALGLYGVLAYAVRQRTHEIGIRMALGATVSEIRLAVLRQASLVLASGLVAGTVGALVLGRWLTSLAFQISPSDPRIVLSAASLLTTTGLMAAWLPAIRASRVAPRIAIQEG